MHGSNAIHHSPQGDLRRSQIDKQVNDISGGSAIDAGFASRRKLIIRCHPIRVPLCNLHGYLMALRVEQGP
jgi:hypothetical protein